nr:hypothetical protein [Brucella anthropi]
MQTLDELLKKAVEAYKALPPEQQREMMEAQRQSWARGEAGLDRDGQTTVVASKPADNIQARLTATSKTILRLRDVLLLASALGSATVAADDFFKLRGVPKKGDNANEASKL